MSILVVCLLACLIETDKPPIGPGAVVHTGEKGMGDLQRLAFFGRQAGRQSINQSE